MLIYVNFTKVKNKLLSKKYTIKNINRDKKRSLTGNQDVEYSFCKVYTGSFLGSSFLSYF